jgi:hypothetical protein
VAGGVPDGRRLRRVDGGRKRAVGPLPPEGRRDVSDRVWSAENACGWQTER